MDNKEHLRRCPITFVVAPDFASFRSWRDDFIQKEIRERRSDMLDIDDNGSRILTHGRQYKFIYQVQQLQGNDERTSILILAGDYSHADPDLRGLLHAVRERFPDHRIEQQ